MTWWERTWFGPGSLVRLAVFRIAMMFAAFYGVWHFRIGVFQHADGVDVAYLARSWNPIYLFDVLGVQPPNALAARVGWVALLCAIALGAVGLCTRVACALVAVLALWWIGTHYSFGKPHHDCVALVFGLLALPLAPAGARLSLDALVRRRRALRRGGAPPDVPERAPWAALPLRLTQVTIALGYFFSGASKLAASGLGWANGYTLQGIMLEYESPWSEALADELWICRILSAGVLLVQTTFPLVFLAPALRWFYVPAAVAFHLMAMMTMGTGPFITLWFTLVAFVPVERAPAFLRSALGSGPTWRRLAVAAVLVAFAWTTASLYFRHMPGVLMLVLVPPLVLAVQALRAAPSVRDEARAA